MKNFEEDSQEDFSVSLGKSTYSAERTMIFRKKKSTTIDRKGGFNDELL